MPLYEYECDKCGAVFEIIQKFSDETLTTHEKCGGLVHRLISASAFQFKGSGWYVNDYARAAKGGESGAKGGESPEGGSKKTESKSDSGDGKSSSGSDASSSSSSSTPAKSESKSSPSESKSSS